MTSYRPDGTVFNQVQRGYNGLGQLTNEYQSHSGAVVVGTTPQVQHGYSVMAGGNHSRLTNMTYPNTSPLRTLTYNYNGTSLDDSISRLTSIRLLSPSRRKQRSAGEEQFARIRE